VAQTFALISSTAPYTDYDKPKTTVQANSLDIFECLASNEDYKRARKLMVSCILATDMSTHFSEVSKLKTRIEASDYDPKGKDKQLTLTMMFHLADISNGTKDFERCRKWTDLLFTEFFTQGDRERSRGASISYLMDRKTVNIAKSQIGFLDVIVSPAYKTVSKVVQMERNLEHIEKNKARWALLFDEYESKMVAEQEKCVDID